METSTLPQWKCHKVVRAAKIDAVTAGDGPGLKLYLAGVPDPVEVSDEWATKHAPRAGGYYVVYDDSYASFSPAKAFEEGYAPLPALAPHMQRVVEEKADLEEKLQKLSAFYSTPIFHSLPESEQTRLLRQGVAMRTYREVLAERIAEF